LRPLSGLRAADRTNVADDGIYVAEWSETAWFRADFVRFVTIRGGESSAEPGSNRVPGSSRSPGGPVRVAAGTGTEGSRKPRALPPEIGVGRGIPTGATHGQESRADQ